MELTIKETSSETKAKRLFTNPAQMNRIKTFAIMTAENPDAIKYSRKDNKERNKDFKASISFDKMLDNKHFSYYKVKGFYGSTEHSFIIYNLTLNDAKELASSQHQLSFIFGKNDSGVLTFEFWANGSKNSYKYRKVDEVNNFNFLDKDAEDNYTQIARDFKIMIPFTKFEVAASEMEESVNRRAVEIGWNDESVDTAINESMDENRAMKYRYFSRMTLGFGKLNND